MNRARYSLLSYTPRRGLDGAFPTCNYPQKRLLTAYLTHVPSLILAAIAAIDLATAITFASGSGMGSRSRPGRWIRPRLEVDGVLLAVFVIRQGAPVPLDLNWWGKAIPVNPHARQALRPRVRV